MSVVEYEGGRAVATVTLDSPENRNALTPALVNGLGDALSAAADDPAVRVVVLTNRGPAFCAGADLSGPSSSSEKENPRYELAQIFSAIQDSPKPVLGRIAGHCLGGGVGLAAACDLSVAASSARFGFTEVRLGVAPAIISVICLPKLRRGDALELFLTGERIPSARAAEIGLITKAVPDEELDIAVSQLTEKLLAGGPLALAASKRLVFEVPGMDRATAFERTTEISQGLFAAPEAAEGMAAFREKRRASWNPES